MALRPGLWLEATRLLSLRLAPWLASIVHRGRYERIGEGDLRRTRRSDTVFLFGSGSSLKDVSDEEFRAFEEHDTIGFNWFVHQRFVRCDYHLVREIGGDDRDESLWRPAIEEYFGLIRDNPFYAQTIFVVQKGLRAINGNRAIALGLLPPHARIFRFRTLGGRATPSNSLREGLARRYATLEECVNFAYLLGWKRIVLVGVDLYDRRYFWLPADETRDVDAMVGATSADLHIQADTGLVEQLGRWGELMRADGVSLEIYNPRSLLARVLPPHRP